MLTSGWIRGWSPRARRKSWSRGGSGDGGAGELLDTPVLGLCQIRDGTLAWAQMFYFGTAAAAGFLALAARTPANRAGAGSVN
jgi:hypothetical protein